MSSGSEVSTELLDELLSLPTPQQQSAFLRDAGLLNAEGLDQLLDTADRLVVGDPGKARQLAELCADLADSAAAPAAVPRASYIRAGTYGINGEFDEELRLTRAAYDGYVALGKNLEALRTNIGRMAALLELGRYQEALDTGRVVLEALDGAGALEVSPTPQEYNLLVALVHHNRGGCLEYMGRYDEALGAYAIAEDKYQALGMTERLGEISSNRGAILLHLGQGSEALAAHETAAVVLGGAGLTLRHAQALANIGETHLHLGNYKNSLDAFEQARRLLGSLDALADKHLLLRDMANAYLALNLYSEAIVAYREADSMLRSAGMTHDQARVLWGMGSALIARSEFEEAEEALAEAADLFAAADNAPLLCSVLLEQASLLDARGDREAALATARRALDLVLGSDLPVQLFYAHLRLADLVLPDVVEAERHLQEARGLSDYLALPHLRYRLNERLGHLRRLQGRDDEARKLLETAIDEIERLRSTVTQDALRTSFLRDKIAAYEDLLRLYLDWEGEQNVRRAFIVAERAKSRALVDLLTGVADKEPGMLADPELERQLQTLQADLNAIYTELLGGPGANKRRASVPDMQARTIELEQEISRLRLQALAAGPTPNPFAASMPTEAILHQLPSDTTLLAYHVIEDEILAFVNGRGNIRVTRQLGTATAVQRLLRKLTLQLDRFRAGREFAERHMAMLERTTRRVLAELYAELVAPLEPLLAEAADYVSEDLSSFQKLAVVPHGLLHQVPFHALFDGQRYLIERFEVSYAPSATIYALCQEQVLRDSDRSLVFGVDDPLIPAAKAEAFAVAEHLPGSEVRVGEGATVAALRNEISGCDIAHLACHGLFRSDNPMFSALKLYDGWLMAVDALQLDLTGTLVTLSACESGRTEVIGGDEILGLTRALLGAGAATLAVSLWLVQDETTAELMSRWYERLRDGEGPAVALRAAQLEMKEQYPHPYYWAPFILIGKR
jgi:CHAT domain-containing protein